LAGLNPNHFQETNAALVHNLAPEPDQFPKMIWNTNYQKLAAATLFTLFFSGKTYAPKCIVNGIHVQDYLQQHYIQCFTHVAQKIKESDLHDSVVIGYDTMNEPGEGYLNVPDITELSKEDTAFKMGVMPTAFEGMLLGSAIPTKVQEWKFTWSGPKYAADVLVDPQGKEAWLSKVELQQADKTFGWERSNSWTAGCIWALHGVWDKSTQEIKAPNYFATHPTTGVPTDYIVFWMDFLQNYSKSIRSVHQDAILFVQPPVLQVPPKMPDSLERLVYAPHWYDGLTLVKKKWLNYNVDFINLTRGKYGTGPFRFLRALRVGEKAIRQGFVDQLETIRKEGLEYIGDYPCVMGEIGIPYDMDSKDNNSQASWVQWFMSFFVNNMDMASIQSPDAPQNKALDANFNALEKNLLNYTLWNYTPDSSAKWGDNWNGEDLSVWQFVTTPSPTESESSETIFVEANTKKDDDDDDVLYSDDSHPLLTPAWDGDMNARDVVSLHRPHPTLTPGVPLSINFVSPTSKAPASFEYAFKPTTESSEPAEIYIPTCYFPLPPDSKVTVSAGEWRVRVANDQYWKLIWRIDQVVDSEVNLKLEGLSA
jgi:hypothetical protein